MSVQAKSSANLITVKPAGEPVPSPAAQEARAERRTTPRLPINLEAAVTLGNRLYPSLHTRDVGFDGVFIETGTRFVLRDRLEVSLRLPVESGVKVCRFRARVARVTPEGAGLTFDRADLDSYAALLHLMCSRKEQQETGH